MPKNRTFKTWHSDYNILLKRASPKTCMAGKSCKSPAKCHSISESRVLSSISDNGEVIAIEPSKEMGLKDMKRSGIGKVSTFSGFCAFHDQRLFKDIDSKDYSFNDVNQHRLFSYRATAYYHFYQLTWWRTQQATLSYYKKLLDQNSHEVKKITKLSTNDIEKLITFYTDECSKAQDLSRQILDLMTKFNKSFTNESALNISTKVIRLNSLFPLAQSGALMLEPRPIWGICHLITITVIPQHDETYILLSCLGEHGTTCIDDYFSTYESDNLESTLIALTNIICMFGESLAINPSYWDSLSDQFRERFIQGINTWGNHSVYPKQLDSNFNIFV